MKNLVRDSIDLLLNRLIGRKRYRIKVIYNINGKEIFNYNTSIHIKFSKFIDEGRTIKKALGPLHKDKTIPKSLLRNGDLLVEPVCYLGRW